MAWHKWNCKGISYIIIYIAYLGGHGPGRRLWRSSQKPVSPGCGHCLSLGTVTGAAKAFEIGGVCVSVGQDVCVCLGFLWLLQAGTHGDLDRQIPACRPGILLGVDRQNIRWKKDDVRVINGCWEAEAWVAVTGGVLQRTFFHGWWKPWWGGSCAHSGVKCAPGFCPPCTSQVRTQVVRFGSKLLYSLSHISGPFFLFCFVLSLPQDLIL